ncbi:FAD-binding and (Fe-S)-binding domain-containing protein [Crossiella cryophila]|uniref:FAD/FMN-containing dehydrogenase/Fe-S oxidoreductase n=1 Tax=Crossiella cryophila TaxID=43355 RepID=A0A7W7C5J4_9PSEU|nr:FAD-binding and (Fe-S)-binding domain-containing protein [Crossiella cryophila]MBB4674897.1 FAD/FMN-containing dehydrogenase/Fe-S oxidoreductase [Crossiella cryophila]
MGIREVDEFGRRLRAELPAATRLDPQTRAAYGSDASIYRVLPTAVLEPRDLDELGAGLAIAREHGVPVTSRGGGTSVAGNAIGTGLVIDFSRHLNRVLAIDPEARTATVQPGVVLDELRRQAAGHGLTFGPDPSTQSRCTLGGMIGNNACGPHSVAWGTTAEVVHRLDLLRADGRALTAGPGGSDDAELDRRLISLRDKHLRELRLELGRFRRQVSGYNLAELLPEKGFHLARALVGSEGTCAVLTGATVALTPLPAAKVLLVLGFADVYTAADQAPLLAAAGALTVEGMDELLIAALGDGPGSVAAKELPPGRAWLYCEVAGADQAQARARAAELAGLVEASALVVTDPARTAALWRIRKDGAGIATRMADGGEAWPGWEDSAVPPERLGGYLRELHALLGAHGYRGIAYGHFGEGCLHLRCDWDLLTPHGVSRYREFIEAAADLVVAHGGTSSGEHGDGRARSALLARTYSPALLAAFAGFKRIFDPDSLLNPGVLVDPRPLDADLRPGHDRIELPVVHALHADNGSFAAAVRRCVGVGSCRQASGAMCPSYQVTGDELHSTRGRARVLGEMLRGELLDPDATEVHAALDLCLSCKACRNECPVQVDMATYKAEFLHHHYRRRLRPRAHYTLGWLPLLARLARPAPGLANAVIARPAARRLAGLEPRRDPVSFARNSFRTWWRRRGGPLGTGTPVLLWPDTFTNFVQPEIGIAAVEVLEALGYRVDLPRGPVCCGLTWHSTGQLDIARRVLRRSVRALAGQGLVIGLEPSCTVLLREDAAELVPEAAGLGARVRTLAEVVAAHQGDWPFGHLDAKAIRQPHCHQQATFGDEAEREVLSRLGIEVDQVDAGCCGLAGNFGFEPGHWDVAQACAERQLYPRIRAAPASTMVLADGFSCRTQAGQGTEVTAEHTASVLRRALSLPASSRSGG